MEAIAAVGIREDELGEDGGAHAAPHGGEGGVGEGAEVVAEVTELDDARAEVADLHGEDDVAAIDADGGAEAPIEHGVGAGLFVPMRGEEGRVEGLVRGVLLFAPDIEAGLVDEGIDLVAEGAGAFVEVVVHDFLAEEDDLPDFVIEGGHGALGRHGFAEGADDGVDLSAFAQAQLPAPFVGGLVHEVGVKGEALVHALEPAGGEVLAGGELGGDDEFAGGGGEGGGVGGGEEGEEGGGGRGGVEGREGGEEEG